MAYRIELEGFEGQNIEVKIPGFFSGAKLFVNGEPAPKGPKHGQMTLRRNDGTEVIATWQGGVWGLDVPKLKVGNEVINIVEPLKWYELIWSGLPILLVFTGGALGALAGFIAFRANSKIFRSGQQIFVKYMLSAGISIAAVIAFFILGTVLANLISS